MLLVLEASRLAGCAGIAEGWAKKDISPGCQAHQRGTSPFPLAGSQLNRKCSPSSPQCHMTGCRLGAEAEVFDVAFALAGALTIIK